MIWAYVSDDFDIKRITRSIIESASGSQFNLTEMDLMKIKLRKLIENKRFLLVLDDVWNENYEKWDRLKTVLIGSARRSKVIVTTRSERVASIMGTVAPHLLSGLSDNDCWLLFEKRAFGLWSCEKTPNLAAIGKEMVKKCGRVPLAAKALGSLMRFGRGESQWLAIKENEIWNLPDDENEILPTLMLSYNHLPSHQKQCFAYCSIFPKGAEIRSKQLVQLWIAEGFVQSSNGGTYLEDVGLLYVDELLSRSLFQSGQEDADGVVMQVKMHDLVHDLARSIAGDECSIADAGDERVISQNCRYASLICRGPIKTILEPLKDAQRMRTLYFIASRGRTEEEGKVDDVLQAIFSKMKLLRALHLRKCPMKALPVSVAKLKLLRYLDLSQTDIETLPSCIGEATEARKANLKEKQGIHSLRLSWDLNAYLQLGQPCEEIENEETSMNELAAQDRDADADLVEEVLGNLQPHKNLRVSEMTEHAGKSLPWWLKESSLPYLAELSLKACVRYEHLSTLEQLPSLKVLKLIMLPTVN
uniref:Disease resistance protein RGA3 n=1 Tax=Elaeis guineensis var. tenera TaxID=51953 RepID=A0A8N4I6A0_ELAGV|nr:putative disease resistance protein RGA3 [Elaeis guineensis]